MEGVGGEEGEVCKQCIPSRYEPGRAWPIEHSPSPIGYGTPPLPFHSSLPVSNTSGVYAVVKHSMRLI
ncbi:hypothetical protein CEXT_790131 [Caerostris extrusa]|uniref:Uncharacterized protein n=1 Tax=Caerostris extrusa TaxID=172846 RepID=A0AAV4TIS3_CAEEX|nr:hypothetical protein CEXT_790131 [Caerostris extrusa]